MQGELVFRRCSKVMLCVVVENVDDGFAVFLCDGDDGVVCVEII